MMTDTSLHPTDAQLLSYLDGEIDVTDAHSVRQHLATCEVCGESTAAFRDVSQDISGWLGSLEGLPASTLPVPERRRIRAPRLAIVPAPARAPSYRRHLTRAAIVIFGLAAALTVEPVRAWVVEVLRFVAASQPPSSDEQSTVPQRDPSSSIVSFVPNGDELSIDIAHHQTSGSLRISTTTDALVSGRVTGTGVASLLVSGDGLRLLNDASSTSSYTVAIPAAVHTIVVRLGGDVILQTTRDALGTDILLPLRADASEAGSRTSGEASR